MDLSRTEEFPVLVHWQQPRCLIGMGAHELAAPSAAGMGLKHVLFVTSGLKGTGIIDEIVAGRVAACLDAAARGSPQATVMPRPTRCDDTTIDPADSLSDGSERDDPDAPEPPRDIVVPERAEQAELRTAPEGIAATTMEDVRAASGG